VRLADVDTPALVVDLDAVERNVDRMQARCDALGLALRPHMKTHKLPALAHLQLARGAVGITCQKLGEAEVMAAAGVRDILISYPLLGAAKAARFAALAGQVRMAAVGDSAAVPEGLSAALAEAGTSAAFLVECDTGYGRTGVQTPEAAAELGALADALPGLRFAGFMTYPATPETGAWLEAAVRAAAERGLDAAWITAGGTPTERREAGERAATVLTEWRPGTYIYGDRSTVADGSVPLEDCALHVRATVVSRPTADRAIIDAGSKALTSDPAAGAEGHGTLLEYPEARVPQLNEEHGYVDLSACGARPEVGEPVTVLPNHACGATNLYDEVVVHRGDRVVAVWPVAARGKSR
jgi:D-serine deaminase-like pyridoxal phosphate-dependent protein